MPPHTSLESDHRIVLPRLDRPFQHAEASSVTGWLPFFALVATFSQKVWRCQRHGSGTGIAGWLRSTLRAAWPHLASTQLFDAAYFGSRTALRMAANIFRIAFRLPLLAMTAGIAPPLSV